MAERQRDAVWRAEMRIGFDFNCVMDEMLGAGLGLQEAEIVALEPRLQGALAVLAQQRRDPVPHQVAWLDLPYRQPWLPDVLAAAEAIRARFGNLVVLGIGGSALGNIALQTALNHPFYNLLPRSARSGPRLFVLDNIDPALVAGLLETIRLEGTCFNVISKSGTTAETMAQFLVFRQQLEKALGPAYREHLLVTTDQRRGFMRQIADEEGLQTLPIPDGVGGRFSVLSPVGLLSAACCGIDVRELLDGAAFADEICQGVDVWRNPAAMNAAVQYLLYGKGYHIAVMMPYSQALRDVADWHRQLWAESLGKRVMVHGQERRVGPTPVKALGATDQHSQIQLYVDGPRDKVVNLLRVRQMAAQVPIPELYQHLEGVAYLGGKEMGRLLDAEAEATALALRDAGCPNCTHWMPEVNAFTVGQLLYTLEVQTAIAGRLWGVNAFDQPGVEAGKRATYGLMGRVGYEAQRQAVEAAAARQRA
ncbi:MAG: glucose-6-phosphate isomerase, partial [Chloroflexi bacterium]|nr:glucose-6-phosphate isomerase [Chloroflexota bacterium]